MTVTSDDKRKESGANGDGYSEAWVKTQRG